MQMPTVPDSVDRPALAAAFESIGIDITHVTKIVVTPRKLELTFRARDHTDTGYLAAGDEVATVTVTLGIPRRSEV